MSEQRPASRSQSRSRRRAIAVRGRAAICSTVPSGQAPKPLSGAPRSKLAVARISRPRPNQVAALLRDYDIRPVVVHPTKRADFSRHGYRAAHFEDAFARFLPPEPNIRTLKRGGGEKT
jgi:hypothetical protein